MADQPEAKLDNIIDGGAVAQSGNRHHSRNVSARLMADYEIEEINASPEVDLPKPVVKKKEVKPYLVPAVSLRS